MGNNRRNLVPRVYSTPVDPGNGVAMGEGFSRLDYQPLFGKMTPRSSPGEERRLDSRERWKSSLHSAVSAENIFVEAVYTKSVSNAVQSFQSD